MLDFIPYIKPDDPIPNNQDIPKDEMDIFFRNEADFLPPGKTFDDLTAEELQLLRSQYRFSPLRPGTYQGITGISGSARGGSM